MPYREKTAWLSLVAMALAYVPYFAVVQQDPGAKHVHNFYYIWCFAGATLVNLLTLGIGHLVLRIRASQDAKLPLDERDTAIMRRSMTSAYYVLIAGMIMVGCIMPINSGGWEIINAAIFMIVLAEVVHYSVVVISYRRQA